MAAVSVQDFTDLMLNAETAFGVLTSWHQLEALEYQGEPGLGYYLAVGELFLEYTLGSTSTAFTAEVVMIRDGSAWKLHTLDQPMEAIGLPGFTLFPPPNHVFEFPSYPVGTPPANYDLQAAAVAAGTPPSNHALNSAGYATGTSATNSDFEAAVVDTVSLQNHDFATGDFTGWAPTGTVLIESNGTQGSYARLNSPGTFVRTEPFTVTVATQVAQFDVGYINASGYSWVKVFIETGATYSTSTQLGQYSCSSCNTWVTILQNLSAYQGQSVRLRFEQYSTFTAGIDNVRLLEYVPSMEILGSVARAGESGNGYVVLDTGGTVTTGPVVVPSDAQYVTMKVRGQSAGDDRFNLQVKSGATFTTESNLLWYISASDGSWATVRADLSAYRGQTVKFRAGRAAGVVAVDDIGFMRVELADYTTKGDVALTAESGNSYALLAGSGTEVITAPFTVDAAAQTIGLSVRGATTGNDQYTVYVQSGASFATETSVLWFLTAADGPWQPVAFPASQYAGQVIRLRILRSGGSVAVDDIGVMTAILPGFALEGTVERLFESGNVVAQLAGGSKMTTAPFTVSLSAQQMTVRAKNTGASASTIQVHVLSGPTYETSTQVISAQLPAASGWTPLAFDAAPFAGQSVRIRVQAVTGSPTVDEPGVAMVTVPSWAASGSVIAITGGPTGAYVSLGGGGTITSEAAQLPGSAQTLSVNYANGAASGSSYFYIELLRGPEFAQVQQLGFVTAGQSQGQWASFSANISAYAGEVVKLRIRRYTGEVWVDDAGVVVP